MENTHYTRAENVTLRDMAGEHFLIVLDIGESRMFNLNSMGLWFWEQLEVPQTKAELLAAMLAEYEVEREIAVAEINRFLAYLREHSLITQCETPPAEKGEKVKGCNFPAELVGREP
ncbi:MAG: PqqD family protein [Kiritimatiellia bacterium]